MSYVLQFTTKNRSRQLPIKLVCAMESTGLAVVGVVAGGAMFSFGPGVLNFVEVGVNSLDSVVLVVVDLVALAGIVAFAAVTSLATVIVLSLDGFELIVDVPLPSVVDDGGALEIVDVLVVDVVVAGRVVVGRGISPGVGRYLVVLVVDSVVLVNRALIIIDVVAVAGIVVVVVFVVTSVATVDALALAGLVPIVAVAVDSRTVDAGELDTAVDLLPAVVVVAVASALGVVVVVGSTSPGVVNFERVAGGVLVVIDVFAVAETVVVVVVTSPSAVDVLALDDVALIVNVPAVSGLVDVP